MRYFRNQRLHPPPIVREIARRSTPRVAGVIPFGDATEDMAEDDASSPSENDRLVETVSILDVVPVTYNSRTSRTELLDHGLDLMGQRDDDHELYYRHDGGRALSGSVPLGASTRDFLYSDNVVLKLSGGSGTSGVAILGATSTPAIGPYATGANEDLAIGAKGSGNLLLGNVSFTTDFGTDNLGAFGVVNFDLYNLAFDSTLYIKNTHATKVANLWVEGDIALGGDLSVTGSMAAHKDSHDPEDGADPLDCAAPLELASVQASGEGSAHTFARSDHAHQVQHSIADNHLVTIDDADAADNDYVKFTADGLEGREKSEVLSDLNVADGADVTGDNAPQVHAASHQNAGGDEVSVTGLSGLLADDQHVLDAEVQAIKLDDFATPDDNTDLDFSTVLHGLVPKGTDVGNYLKDDGTWAPAAGGGDVTAGANLTDNAVICGDGGAKGVQTRGVLIDDADVMSGITQLNVDNLRLDGNTISGTGGDGIVLTPPSGDTLRGNFVGSVTNSRSAWEIHNYAWNVAMIDTGIGIAFYQAVQAGGVGVAETKVSGAIFVSTETNWTGSGTSQDSYMALWTTLDGASAEKVRINSAGAVGINTTDPGGLIAGNLLDLRQDQNRCTMGMFTAHDTQASRGSSYYGGRCRGTIAAPVKPDAGDTLFAFVCLGYDSAVWKAAAQIIFKTDGVSAAGAVPTEIAFRTGPTAATIADRLIIQSDGDILVDTDSKMMFRDSDIFIHSSVDGKLDIDADTEIELSSARIELNAADITIPLATGIQWQGVPDADVSLLKVHVTGTPEQSWDESEDAFAMTHRLFLPEGVRTKYATDDVADPPTDAELDTAFGDPTVVGSGFVGVLDDNDAGTDCYICWTTGTAGEWFYVKGTKAV